MDTAPPVVSSLGHSPPPSWEGTPLPSLWNADKLEIRTEHLGVIGLSCLVRWPPLPVAALPESRRTPGMMLPPESGPHGRPRRLPTSASTLSRLEAQVPL